MQTMDVWELLESAPDYAENTADLYHWSTNFDSGTGPFTLFLDLIGWSEDEIGNDLYDYANRSLGYLELSKVAAALEEYSSRPADVRAFVDKLVQAEMQD